METVPPRSNQPTRELATLDDLAARINDEHAETFRHLHQALQHARQAGELLLQARRMCPYGTWGPWLKANVVFSDRTARAYMQVAARWPELEARLLNRQPVAELGLREALELLAGTDDGEQRALPAGTRTVRSERPRG